MLASPLEASRRIMEGWVMVRWEVYACSKVESAPAPLPEGL